MNFALLIQQLIDHEGLRLKPYRDTVGKLTIGVGRNLDDVGITESEARTLLENDISTVCRELDRALPWWRDLSEPRQRALADMAFNLGTPRLLGFKRMIAALERKDYEEAANEMLLSQWADQVKSRAVRLAAAMRGA